MKQSYTASVRTGWPAFVAPCLLLALLLARPAQAQTTLFACTGGSQTYTVPAGVTLLQVVATGATNGAVVRATVTVTPTETLTVEVGGTGSLSGPSGGSSGTPYGYNGGGGSGFAGRGGGATDLRRSGPGTGDYLASRNALLVAGGGGGYGYSYVNDIDYPGGSGGAQTGGNGTGSGGYTGFGATPTAAGAAAAGATAGSANTGGARAGYGGSGGGGYHGGGGGNSSGNNQEAGGGGGGSSWVMPTGSSSISYATSAAAGNGTMTITPVPPATVISSFSPTSGLPGTAITLTGTGFTGTTGVSFNGVPTTGLTVTSPTTLTAYVPVGATTGSLRVSTAGGTGTSAAAFTVTAIAPDVAAVTVTPAGPLSACGGPTLTAVATLKPFLPTGTGLNRRVNAVAVQPDGKLLLGGLFTTYNGTATNYVVRLNADGTRDATFAPTGSGLNAIVYAVAVQPDGKLLVGGYFTTYNGVAANNVIRLNADGTRDATFAPTGTGLNDGVAALAVQPDGKLLVGGGFTTYNGVAAKYVIRLNANGTRDASFAPGSTGLGGGGSFGGSVSALAVQPDGKLLVGGNFNSYDGAAANFVVRLNADGTRDASFAPTGTGLDSFVNAVAVQPDGKLLLGGRFTSYNGATANRVLRLNADGTRDASFAPASTGFDNYPFAVAVQPDGKLLVGGVFTTYNGVAANRVIRLNADGTRDATFAPTGSGLNNAVAALAVQPDGKLLLGGFFVTYDGAAANYVIRLNADGTSDATATAAPGATYAWTPGGSTGGTVLPTTAGGNYQVTATVGGYNFLSNTVSVTACAPTVTSFAPTGGLPGTAITLTGTDFTGATGVSFNGVPTTGLTVTSPTTLTAYVPVGATTGPLRVSTAGGTGTSAATFTVTAIAPDVAVAVTPAGPLSACGGPTLTAAATIKPFVSTGTGFNGGVTAVAMQPDGKLLLGGFFTSYNGTVANRVVRLNVDGTRDVSFAPTGTGLNNEVRALAVQPDGKVLLGGVFNSYNGAAANYVIRLNADGTRDATFVPTGAGFGSLVNAVAVQPDGKLLVGGVFTSYDGAAANRVIRLNADGTRDATFTPTGTGLNGSVDDMAVQPDGKLLLGGFFSSYNGAAATGVIRLNADGTRDATFALTGFGLNSFVNAVAVQPDGKLLVGGRFTSYNGAAANRVVRLNADGTRDVSFAPTGTGLNNEVQSLAVQPDGKVLLGGVFDSYNGAAATYVIRLNADGTRDASFAPMGTGLNGSVTAVAVQPDGKLLLGGFFSSYNGAATNRVVRLNADGTRDATATAAPGATYAWMPGSSTGATVVPTAAGGSYQATATVGGYAFGSNTVSVTTCVPTITSFSPTGGLPGTVVTLTGTNFTGATGVSFNGVPTTGLTVTSPTTLTAYVPVGATTGPLRVTAGGTGTSAAAFTVAAIVPDVAAVTVTPAGPLSACGGATLTAVATIKPFVTTGTGLNNPVLAVAVQPDGKLLLGGTFTNYDGAAANRVIRLNANGSRDATFAPTGTGLNNIVRAVAVQPDGKVLLGGTFTSYDGALANRVIRLNADGTRDATFAPTGTGLGDAVQALAVQPDGKLLVGGFFTTYNGVAATRVIRLNADGTRDATFAPTGTGFNNTVQAVVVQPDGKLLLGGQFTTYNGAAANFVIRLNADGTRDVTFAPTGSGPNNSVNVVAVQPDGQLLVGGVFTSYDGPVANPVVRLSANGTRDATFAPAGVGTNSNVRAVAVQPDGKLLVVGTFTGGNFVIRLNADGTRDAAFATTGTGFNGTVGKVALQPDGKLLLNGFFTTYDGTAAPYVIRLNADGTRDATATAAPGATYAWTPGNSTGATVVPTAAGGSYQATATVVGYDFLSNTVSVTACVPTLTSLDLTSGPVGTSVTLTGSNLTGATAVTFSGTSNNTVTTGLTVSGTGSSQTLTVLVPTGAATGSVTVTTPGGTSNGLVFTVTVPVGDLTVDNTNSTAGVPYSIAAGTYNTITVTGTGFATLGGAVVVNTALAVSGTLLTSCQALTGAGSFILTAGATLGICEPAGISGTGASGAVQVTGTRSFSADAAYVYNGPQAQSTGPGLPATVRALTVANPTEVGLTQAVTIAQTLTLAGAGNLRLNFNTLLLRSDASGTALVVNAGTGVVLGNTATMQRHIGTNTAATGYRHYASPMQAGSGVETLTTLATAGYAPDFSGAAAYNSSATPGAVTPFPTVFRYNQDRIAGLASTYGPFDKGWQAALGTEVPQAGRGYAVQAPGAVLVDFTGTLTSGPVSRPNLQRASTDATTGWHLLGNPFPSPLDWSTMSVGTSAADNLQHMDGAVYVSQSSGPYAGSYRTYLAAAPGLGSPIIPAGSGFFVHTTSPATPGTVRFTTANRVTSFGPQPAFGRGPDLRPQLTLELRGTGGRDAVTVYADPAATPGLDATYDAAKLPNPTGLNLSAQAGPNPLAIDGLPTFSAATVVPLSVGVPAAGSYALQVNQLLNLPAGATAVLVDALLNTRTDLATLPAAGYVFSVSPAQAATLITGRFFLNLGAAGPLATTAGRAAPAVQLYPNPVRGGAATLTGAVPGTVVTVFDALGRLVTSAPANATGTAVLALPAGLATGVYVVRVGSQAIRLTVE